MLVLARKVGQEIVIDGHTTIRIARVRGNQVSLAITAPPNVKVLRAELIGKDRKQHDD